AAAPWSYVLADASVIPGTTAEYKLPADSFDSFGPMPSSLITAATQLPAPLDLLSSSGSTTLGMQQPHCQHGVAKAASSVVGLLKGFGHKAVQAAQVGLQHLEAALEKLETQADTKQDKSERLPVLNTLPLVVQQQVADLMSRQAAAEQEAQEEAALAQLPPLSVDVRTHGI
ncbi:hypothetical protein HaLaN_10583, partial [Haematococcus lacustris]